MELIDFGKYPSSAFGYGGMSGKKRNIVIDGRQYMLKFPDNLKHKGMRNVALSYSNGPVSEHLGSLVYKDLGIPAHNTLLGTYEDKIVVACQHIYEDNERLTSFAEYRNTLLDSSSSDGTSVRLDDVMESLASLERDAPGATERFWDMFAVDALIGNADRNNGNWGLIFETGGELPRLSRLAPVFDNGASFNPKWDEGKFREFLADPEKLESVAHRGVVSIFTGEKGRRVNPFKYMENAGNEDCLDAVRRIVPEISLENIKKNISELHGNNLLGDSQAEFYMRILEKRMEERLLPLLERLDQRSRLSM